MKKKLNEKKSLALIGISGIILVATVMSFLVFQPVTAGIPTPERWWHRGIRAFEKALQRPDLSAEGRQNLERGLQGLYAMSTQATRPRNESSENPTQVELARQQIATELAIKRTVRPTYGSPPLTGIIQNMPAPFPSGRYEINNGWRELIDGGYVHVYAGGLGSERGDYNQGVVVVLNEATRTNSEHLTPRKNGRLRVIAATRDHRLTLQAEDGTLYYFDVLANAFINSLDATTIPPTPNRLTATPTTAPPYPEP